MAELRGQGAAGEFGENLLFAIDTSAIDALAMGALAMGALQSICHHLRAAKPAWLRLG
jgi:hypothetical protein